MSVVFLDSRCPQEVLDLGWPTLVYESKCYFLGTIAKTWASAQSTCTSLSSHLVIFEDAAEQAAVDSWLSTELGRPYHDEIWTGGHKTNGYWKWAGPHGGKSSVCIAAVSMRVYTNFCIEDHIAGERFVQVLCIFSVLRYDSCQADD